MAQITPLDSGDDAAQTELQRRRLLVSQPPEPAPGTETEATDPTASAPVKKTALAQRDPNAPFAAPLNRDPSRYDPYPEDLQFHPTQVPNPAQFGLGPVAAYSSPFEVFKNPLVVFATVGSFFSRRGAINAMNFASGAMNGFHEGDMQQYEFNKTKFDENMKAVVEQNRVELERYKAAWDLHSEMTDKKFVEFYMQSVKTDDPIVQSLMKAGDYHGAAQVLVKRDQTIDAANRAYEVEEARNAAKKEEVDRLKQDPAVQAQADAVMHYRQPMPPLSRANPHNQAVNELVTERSVAAGVPYDQPSFGAHNKFVTGLGSTTVGSSGGQINSAKIVIRHLATLDQLIDDLGSGNVARFRAAAQRIQTEFGLSSAPTNFDTAVGLVAGEIIKLVEGSGGTGEDRSRVATAFNRANSAPLLHDAVDVAREVMSARVDSLAEQAKASYSENQFNRFLPPDIRQLLEPRRGRGFDVEGFKAKARAAGYSEEQINKFLADKGH